jgi:uroporphyrinogen decarboxylase
VPSGIAVQGNLDPALLRAEAGEVRTATRRLLESMRDRPGHVLNLGHGVPPDARLESIQSLVETVRQFA